MRCIAAQQIRDCLITDDTIGIDQFIHEALGRGGKQHTAYIQNALTTNNNSVGIGKHNVATNLPIHQTIKCAVDHRLGVVNQVNQVARFCGEMKVDGIAGCNLKVVKAIEAAVTPDSVCANVRKGSTYIHSRVRAATDFDGIGRYLYPGRNAKRRHNGGRQGMLD